jgi:hypothetical protein
MRSTVGDPAEAIGLMAAGIFFGADPPMLEFPIHMNEKARND